MKDSILSNPYVEQNLLSAMLCDPEASIPAARTLDPSAFSDPICAAVFEAIVFLDREGKPVDSATITSFPAISEYPSDIIGEFLGNLYAANRAGVAAPSYVELLAEAARRRELAGVGEKLYQEALHGNPLDNSTDITARAVAGLTGASARYSCSDLHTRSAEELIDAAMALAETRALSEGISGVPSGITDLDAYTSGFMRGDLIVIGARPAMGKSVLKATFAQNAASLGHRGLYFGTEMRGEQTMGRFICNAASIDASRWKSGRINNPERERLNAYRKAAAHTPLWINDNPELTTEMVYEIACRKRDEWGGLDWIVVDYLQRLSPSSKTRRSDRRIEIGQMARDLKNTALKLNVPLVTGSQIGRHVEKREDKRPGLGDFMESGDVEAEADTALMIYRESYYDRKYYSVDEAEIIVAKQREGPTGIVKCRWVPENLRFCNLPLVARQAR